MKKILIALIAGAFIKNVGFADTIPVKTFTYTGPFVIGKTLTVGTDSMHAPEKLDISSLIKHNFGHNEKTGTAVTNGEVISGGESNEIYNISFALQTDHYTKATVKVKGTDNYKIALDGKDTSPELTLLPSTYKINIRYLTQAGTKDTVSVDIITDTPQYLTLRTDGKRNYTLDDVLHATRINSVSISPDGKWLLTSYSATRPGGSSYSWQTLRNLTTGATTTLNGPRANWLPKTNSYYYEQNGNDGREIVVINPSTGQKSILANNLPSGRYIISPDEKYLYYFIRKEGPKEDPDIYQVLEPDDRQPGWRDRNHIARYDLSTGIYQPITDGRYSANLMDISDDGSKILFSVSRSRLQRRPTTITDLYILDLISSDIDTIVRNDGFIGRAMFSPDASELLISGSPETLDGIGANVPEGRIPSMTDTQLYRYNVKDRKFTPLTKYFDPSVSSFEWNRADGKIYFTAEDRDKISFFCLNPANGNISKIPVPEDMVNSFTLPQNGTNAVLVGQSASNSDRSYQFDTKTLRFQLLDEPFANKIAEIKLGECNPWSFVNSRGDSIHGRFYLPPDFDPSKKYPMIVNYYGGCSPTGRNFESRYPHHAYAALGYIVYVINPSGATGFGQEFSSRHVNTAGEGVADDIIEGTKLFCETHPYVDSSKIGCIGASYGGFMTQYLQTVTDIFAAAISHAGISDHTSYWGNGYWGYSYSEVSMANSYPWSDTELYVSQSPLYRADKITTPILFLHGDSDNNVPYGESIQLFTALKLLGRETALVAVSDQDHHILDYNKRHKWQNTIWAWFAKYLQDDPTWWDAMYPPKEL